MSVPASLARGSWLAPASASPDFPPRAPCGAPTLVLPEPHPVPLPFHVHALVALVEQGRPLDAFERFYADDVVMQENLAPPTVGKGANRERERAFVARIRDVHESRARLVLVDGDHAVIRWLLDFTDADGVRLRFDQLALQTWRDEGGESRVVHERFVYDPATLTARAAA
ncbi:nuclear transport factor 2 family protein [Roseisolibacter sp. H3M3-2]|uniref:nuclear transport factor 2 family protein n=1 Tax=Roseisolibacter sp. H3M3-2 TaxID=3031323 RepID=UPI0023D9F33F|nr:nuclear transport factor 2 family protein [Roseisolibacter sp. H3M3-2]MDF1505551.1 nuclear transport factor 2 family protein [Roseisolibacter sp. H3M3-2]